MRDPLDLLGAASLFSVLAALIPFLLGLAIPYAVLRLRPAREQDPDPQVGIKSVLHYAFSLSILMIIGGVSFLVSDALSDRDANFKQQPQQPFGRPGFQPAPAPAPRDHDFTRPQRIAFAIIVSGFAVGLLHLVLLLGFTNDRTRPETRRVFVGCRLAVHSLVVLLFFTGLLIEMFDVDTKMETVKRILGVLIVWGPSWAVHLILLRLYRFANYRPRPVRLSVDDLED